MYERGIKGWLKHFDFILLDMLSLALALFAAFSLRFSQAWGSYQTELYRELLVMLMLLDFTVCVMFNTMHDVLRRGMYQEVLESVKHAAIVFAVMTVLLVALKISNSYSRIILYGTSALHMVLGCALRQIYKKLLQKRIKHEKRRAVLIVAPEARAAEVAQMLLTTANDAFDLAGLVLSDRDAQGETLNGIPVVANLSDAAEYICREWVDEVFIEADAIKAAEKLVAQCQEMGVVVHEQLMLESGVSQKQLVEHIGDYTVLTSTVNYATPFQALVKRLMDIVGGLIGCVLAGIIILIVGPQIKKASPGPIIYSQERIGQNGRRFKFYKIRSMYLDADERKKDLMKENRVSDGLMFKLDFDPRIIGNEILPDGTKKTGIGAFIRNTSLDEFPQFFNVLKGDMSLVGTRPPTVDEWDKYELHHRARMAMKPGITGMWQVSGRSDITDFEQIVKLDTQYICNWSIGLDLKILCQTVSAVLAFSKLIRSKEEWAVRPREVRFDGPSLKAVIVQGLPSGIQNSVISLANVIVQANINSFGALAMAGCGSYSKVEGFAFLPVTCFSMALATFVSQNVGAGKPDRVHKGMRFGVICSITLAECVGVAVCLLAPWLIGAFSSEADVVAFGVRQAHTIALFYFLLAFSHCCAGILRGLGRPIVPMAVMLAVWCALRITYITVTLHFIHDIGVIFWAYPLTWSISSLMFLHYLRHCTIPRVGGGAPHDMKDV